MEIYEILANLREEKDVSQKEVASIIHVARSSMSLYEKGEITPPIKTLILLANYYGVNMDYITGRTGIKLPLSKIEELLQTKNGNVFSLDKLMALSPQAKEELNKHMMTLYENEQLKKQAKR